MQTLATVTAILAISWLSHHWLSFRRIASKVDFIPTVGSSGFIGAYLTAWKFVFVGHKLIEAGYKKYPGGVFKVATFDGISGWLIVVSGQKMVEDMRKAGPAQLHSLDHIVHILQARHTFSKEVIDAEQYHTQVTQRQMTKNIAPLFPDIVDEMRYAFDKRLPLAQDWTSYHLSKTFLQIVCGMSNRFFFTDLPLCRNQEFLDLQINFAVHLAIGAKIIGVFPEFLRPLAGQIFSRAPSTLKRLKKLLGPMLEERLRNCAELGPRYEGRPNDLVSWLLESAPEDQRTVEDLVTRIMFSNVAAVHTASMTVCETLLNIAARQEYLEPLRAEADQAVAEYGWTREAGNQMHKLDSFIKECLRMYSMNAVSISRSTMSDFTFSNGVTIPAGFSIASVSQAVQLDNSLYENSADFDGYRFVSAEKGLVDLSLVAQDNKTFHFGAGRHMCPGRFFAVAEVKAAVAHVLINYDFRLPDGATIVPKHMWFGCNQTPNRNARIEFRKRRN